MLPDPKDVAKFLRKTIFKSAGDRRAEAEINRDVQVRMGKARLHRHLSQQKNMLEKLTSLAKRALALDDQARFRQVGRQILWTQADIQRWEQYLLTLEVLEARRDQAKASVDLLQSIKTMGESLAELAEPVEIVDLHRQLEAGLARASSLEERMAIMMEVMDATLTSGLQVDESALGDLEGRLTEEVAAEETLEFDREIEAGLKKIKEELGDDKK